MKNKLGIGFEIGNTYSDNAFVCMIINIMGKDTDVWQVDCFTALETYCNTAIDAPLSSKALLELLSSSKQIMFIRMLRKSSDVTVSSVNTYAEFLSSNYDLCILCYDVGYYEVYSKNPADIDSLDDSIPKNMYLSKEVYRSLDDAREDFLV